MSPLLHQMLFFSPAGMSLQRGICLTLICAASSRSRVSAGRKVPPVLRVPVGMSVVSQRGHTFVCHFTRLRDPKRGKIVLKGVSKFCVARAEWR